MTRADRPLTKRQLKFIDAYIHLEDLAKAAVQAGADPSWGKTCWKNTRIRAEIEKRQAVVIQEKAKLKAQKDALNVELLDKELVKTVQTSAKENGHVKVKAIELGYRRIGLMNPDDSFVPDTPIKDVGGEKPETPRIYRALDTTIITHTIETHQVQQSRELITAPPPKTIDASPPKSQEEPVNWLSNS